MGERGLRKGTKKRCAGWYTFRVVRDERVRPGLFLCRSLVNQVHELVKLRSDDDLGAAVSGTSGLGVVVGNGVVLATASGCQTAWVDAVFVLELLND